MATMGLHSMTRYVFRKGFSLQPTQAGEGHLTDTRTGDALLVPSFHVALLGGASKEGLDTRLPGMLEIIERYGPFLIEAQPTAAVEEPLRASVPVVAPHPDPLPASQGEGALLLSAEDELKAALASASGGEQPAPSGQFLSQEENLRQALEGQAPDTSPHAPPAPPPVPAPLPVPPPSLPVSAKPEPVVVPSASIPPVISPLLIGPLTEALKPRRSPVWLTVLGVVLLAAGVVASFMLRPAREIPPTGAEPEPSSAPATPDAPEMAQPEKAEGPRDEKPAALVPDASATVEGPERVAEPPGTGAWHEAVIQAKGRVKMGELVAAAPGVVDWLVTDGQRVKTKQKLGAFSTKETSRSHTLLANSVGMLVLKQPSHTWVKAGTVLAEIIYLEAWARATVRNVEPDVRWRCEVVSAQAQARTDCRVSVVTARPGGGAQVTVAIEPRWFDTAPDAVLRLAPP